MAGPSVSGKFRYICINKPDITIGIKKLLSVKWILAEVVSANKLGYQCLQFVFYLIISQILVKILAVLSYIATQIYQHCPNYMV